MIIDNRNECYLMTINKSQDQTFNSVEIYFTILKVFHFKSYKESPHIVMAKVLDCGLKVNKFKPKSCYEPPNSLGYRLNSITAIIPQGWLWHEIIHEGWLPLNKET